MPTSTPLQYEGAAWFRQRLVLATLSGRAVRIDKIREADDDPGLRPFEVSLLRLLEKVTNGSFVEINYTGTAMVYRPGVIFGGSGLVHDCGTERSVGYFIDALLALAPFAKKPLAITLTGVTNEATDPSADLVRTISLPLLAKFGVAERAELKVVKRGAPPGGGGEVRLTLPVVRQLQPVDLTELGRVKRIRGIAYSTRVSPRTGPRLAEAARGVLNKLLPDVYVYTDHYKGAESGKSPGFGLALVAETTAGIAIGAEAVAALGETAEDVAGVAARRLMEEVSRAGCVDTDHQGLAVLLMAVTPPDVSRLRVGMLSPYTIQYLRHIRDFLGVTFRIETDEATRTAILTCVGAGHVNLGKKLQ